MGAPANPANLLIRAGVAVGGLAAFLATASPAHAQGLHCTATDGDTLRCGPKRVRIIGLDAPELHALCPAELTMARAARVRMAELVADGVTLRPRGQDRYRRLLAVVVDARGKDVAAVVVGEGLARAYDGRGRRQGWCEPTQAFQQK